ncbi:hypothetical protein CLF_104832 [Clonorchis sinensis]|uniref:Uncharacterized protein n=1 Tax=Clonorchis sinensis TaxID=79923 RepID=G7YP03_CLOSI|nr:hypothetical protein CLF_104832 [Clonorchis sinensis]
MRRAVEAGLAGELSRNCVPAYAFLRDAYVWLTVPCHYICAVTMNLEPENNGEESWRPSKLHEAGIDVLLICRSSRSYSFTMLTRDCAFDSLLGKQQGVVDRARSGITGDVRQVEIIQHPFRPMREGMQRDNKGQLSNGETEKRHYLDVCVGGYPRNPAQCHESGTVTGRHSLMACPEFTAFLLVPGGSCCAHSENRLIPMDLRQKSKVLATPLYSLFVLPTNSIILRLMTFRFYTNLRKLLLVSTLQKVKRFGYDVPVLNQSTVVTAPSLIAAYLGCGQSTRACRTAVKITRKSDFWYQRTIAKITMHTSNKPRYILLCKYRRSYKIVRYNHQPEDKTAVHFATKSISSEGNRNRRAAHRVTAVGTVTSWPLTFDHEASPHRVGLLRFPFIAQLRYWSPLNFVDVSFVPIRQTWHV